MLPEYTDANDFNVFSRIIIETDIWRINGLTSRGLPRVFNSLARQVMRRRNVDALCFVAQTMLHVFIITRLMADDMHSLTISGIRRGSAAAPFKAIGSIAWISLSASSFRKATNAYL